MQEKIIETLDIDEYEVWTDEGWKEITNIHKTIPYDIWEVKTESYTLKCADEHIVIDKNHNQIFVKDLKIGDELITESGIEKVVVVSKLELEPENMYDVTINSDNHTLFTNGILSHNTTTASIYILWYALFNKSKTVAILS